ncbi:MAG: TIGR02281 family clan AA aspartic protease [Pseudomonadota bacterium]|nr:TIGR02281 family clan AA aspartic protease [Pseudomonadota bacterium]
MSDDQGPNLLYMVLLLVLVASSLVGMRLPLGKTLKMASAWVAIFAAGFAIFSFRSEFMAIGSRLKAEAIGTPIQAGEELRIPMADDGHFWVEASVNGQEAPFLVDSGASITTISRDTANQAGIETGMRVALVETANGTVEMRKARAESFSVGAIQRSDFAIQVNDHDDGNVLGMNFLSSLQSWRVEGNYLVLQP